MRGGSLGFMNIISQEYIIYVLLSEIYFVQNLSIEFLCAELQISCEFLLVETNILFAHAAVEQQNFREASFLNFCCLTKTLLDRLFPLSLFSCHPRLMVLVVHLLNSVLVRIMNCKVWGRVGFPILLRGSGKTSCPTSR